MEGGASGIVQLLCDLSEASDDVFQDAWLGDECRQHIGALATMGVIEPGPTPATVTCTMCDADHAATLNYDPASRRYVHFCPEAGFVTMNDADLATHRFRPEWLVDWIVRELPITSPPRRRAIVPECVWHLGDAKCGDTWVTAIFARRISNLAALERLASELRTIHPAEKGIVLTTSMNAARHVQLPGKYELLPLTEIIRAVPDGLMLDIQRLGFWLRGMEPSTVKRGATRSGRPSIQADIVAQIYDKRRSQGLPIRSDRREAQEILKEWREHTSDRPPPHVSTLRRYVARLGGGRSAS